MRRGLLLADDARAMARWQHGGGFSVDGSVRIAAADRAGRERLLRYCARPPFAPERLRELDCDRLVYDNLSEANSCLRRNGCVKQTAAMGLPSILVKGSRSGR